MERYEIVYRLSADEGLHEVDARDVADVIYSFSDIVQSALEESGEKGQLSIRVRPFKQGSFITEFVLTYSQPVVSFFSSPEGTALVGILGILGFVGASPVCIPKIVKKVRGRIDRYSKTSDGRYAYGEGDDAIIVDEQTHRILQSPKVAKSFRAITVGPIVKIDKSINITIQDKKDFEANNSPVALFNSGDIDTIDEYSHIAEHGAPEESDEIVSIVTNAILKPVAGPYDGDENGYTFKQGDQTLRRVKIHDISFRMKLESGEIRLMNKDILVVDLEETQTVTASGRVSVERVVTKVKRYTPYNVSYQPSFDEIMSDSGLHP